MLIYQNSTDRFIVDVRENRISDIIADNFKSRFGYHPPQSEWNSWQNSLSKVRDVVEIAGLRDNAIAVEYEIPYNQSRLDCLLFGKGDNGLSNILLIELKQWSTVAATDIDGNFVETYLGGPDRIVPHPSEQVEGYDKYLRNFVTALDGDGSIILESCVYCHNYTKVDGEGLFDEKYSSIVEAYPVFTKDDAVVLGKKIKNLLQKGEGFEVFNRFMQSPIKPSQKLLDNVAKVVKNETVFSLINEQIVAKNLIWSKVQRAKKNKEKSVIIVHGGPGTGKSVIAINLLAEAARRGRTVFYGCKSKPFTEGLKKLVGGDGKMLFSNLYRFLPSRMRKDEVELLLIDEAHRIEKSSNFQYTRKEDWTDMPQIDQLIRCARTSVFFIDDKQNVRSQEIGQSNLIRESAAAYSAMISEVTLNTQFRCMGSNDYLLWLESVLGHSAETRILRKNDLFDFRIINSPERIYQLLKEKEVQKPNSARLVAGFCWPWSKELDNDGNFPNDVRVGSFAMPWETHDNITPPKGYVRWYEWAYRTEGIKQIGCIYTAQGFEFDYIGVIVGKDLVYDSQGNRLGTDIRATADPMLRRSPDSFDSHVRNIYRTLMSRGIKGCYVYFIDKDVDAFVRSRIEY